MERSRVDHFIKLRHWHQIVLTILDLYLQGILSGSLDAGLLCKLLPGWIQVDVEDVEVIVILIPEEVLLRISLLNRGVLNSNIMLRRHSWPTKITCIWARTGVTITEILITNWICNPN